MKFFNSVRSAACATMALSLLVGCGEGGTVTDTELAGVGTSALGEASPDPTPDMSLSELIEGENNDC